MKLLPPFFVLFFGLMFYCHETFSQYDSLVHNSLVRTYLVHTPTSYTGATSLPLIIAMHGGFGSATNLQDQSQLSLKADAEHFIVVYPEGVRSLLNIRTWNAGGCCGYAVTNNIDDVGFIDVLMDTMISQYNIDTTRIYATGMSNGGFMSYRLACELSHRIAAIAPVAATMNFPPCNPMRTMPIIHFHSYLDGSVPYQGGVGGGVSNHYNPPHDSVLNAWSGHNNCLIANDTIIHNSQFTFVKWSECDCEYEMHYYISTDGGHSWPGGNQTAVGDPPSTFINANDLMWDFFQLHSLECDSLTSVHTLSPLKEPLRLFPNPTTGVCNLEIGPFDNIHIADIFGRIIEVEYKVVENGIQIDLSNTTSGIYFVFVAYKDGSINASRFIKIK